MGIVGTGMGSAGNGLSLAESLLEEDEVLLRIQIRRDALSRAGRPGFARPKASGNVIPPHGRIQ